MSSLQRFTDNVFSGRSYEDEDRDFHVITTDHEYMIDIGLGVFTTGVLQKWWDQYNGNGNYPNRNLVSPTGANIGEDIYAADKSSDYANFTSWRQSSSSYTKYIHVTSSSSSDNNWRFSGTSNGTSLNFDVDDLDLSKYKKYETTDDLNNGGTHTGMAAFDSDDSILRLIEINNYVRIKKINDSDETQWGTSDRARAEFIRDIKSSLGGCITWQKDIKFVFNFGTGQDPVEKSDTVTFKLYLFDNNTPYRNQRKAAISDFTLVGTPLNSIGISYRNGSMLNGDFEAPDTNDTTGGKAGGNLKVSYNETTGEWESGTTQVIARLLEDIAATTLPDVDAVFDGDISDILDSNNDLYHKVNTGKAMPISVQNGNPLQWSPNYKEPKGCRSSSDKKKNVLPVINLANRSWSKGDIVMLNYIQGGWVVSPFVSAPADAGTVTAGIDGQWDFTYLMTNAEYFFRRVDGSDYPNTLKTFTYAEYENEFYNQYYQYSSLITGLQPLSRKTEPGYYHTTSWDFMGSTIGGNRTKGHAIAQTQFATDTADNGLGDNQDGKNVAGTFSAPFFGCVFPDGYTSTDIYTKYQDLTKNNIELKTVNSTAYGSDFFIDITGGNVFENQNDNNGTDYGIFALNSSLLKHLPADIALNSSPDGVNGRPISDINLIASNFDVTQSNLQSLCEDYFSNDHYSWMYQKDTNSNTTDTTISAFDLQPVDTSKVEFRPLKAETYALLEHATRTSADNQSDGSRGEFGARGWQTVDSNECPISINSILNRNRGLHGQKVVNDQDAPSSQSLRYGWYDFDHMNTTFRNLAVPDGAKFPFLYWDDAYNDRPGGAVGVIGAVCTVTANTAISFLTENYLGMGTTFTDGEWAASWGGLRGNSYSNLNTTQLYVRVFTQWPRDLTVYDHRFFAVHHFNYGVGKLNEEIDVENDIDVAGTEVDIRVPTWKSTQSDYSSYAQYNNRTDKQSVLDTTWIYQDAPLRDKTEWNIPDDEGRQRRGKLLPYSYTKTTIGINDSAYTYFITGTSSDNAVTVDGGNNGLGYDIMVIDKGANYLTSDTFTTSGGSGSGVLLKPAAIDNNGGITDFEFVGGKNTGTDFLPEDFLLSDDILNGNVVSKVKIVANSVEVGEGLEAYIIRGKVQQSDLLIDEAPQELTTSAIQLTPNPPIVTDSNSAVPILDENKDQSLNITSIVSSNKKYDVYLHFHNDISHTFADLWAFSPNSREQVCRLKITPT